MARTLDNGALTGHILAEYVTGYWSWIVGELATSANDARQKASTNVSLNCFRSKCQRTVLLRLTNLALQQ